MTETLELTVPELDCAEVAQQIEAALGRLPGVDEVRTAVGARTAVVAYHPERIQPDAIRDAIRGLGMTIADPRAPGPGRRRSLPDLLGSGVYLGGSAETGRMSNRFDGLPSPGQLWSGSVFLGADTFVGPLFLGVGAAPAGRWTLYMLLGAP